MIFANYENGVKLALSPSSTSYVVFDKSLLHLIANMQLTKKTSDHAEPPPRVNVSQGIMGKRSRPADVLHMRVYL